MHQGGKFGSQLWVDITKETNNFGLAQKEACWPANVTSQLLEASFEIKRDDLHVPLLQGCALHFRLIATIIITRLVPHT